jgi:hypothetical protein
MKFIMKVWSQIKDAQIYQLGNALVLVLLMVNIARILLGLLPVLGEQPLPLRNQPAERLSAQIEFKNCASRHNTPLNEI